MKKLLTILLSVVLGVMLCACDFGGSDTTPTNEVPTNTPVQVNTATPAPEEVSISILGCRIVQDYSERDVLVVEYEFTHYSDEPQSFIFLFNDVAFQNGVECSSAVVSSEIDSLKRMNEVQPGVAYQVEVGYLLQDTASDVEIQVKNLFKTKTYFTQTVKLA